jgi:hypothetical protein
MKKLMILSVLVFGFIQSTTALPTAAGKVETVKSAHVKVLKLKKEPVPKATAARAVIDMEPMCFRTICFFGVCWTYEVPCK